jgi:hypothetical protein
MSAKLSSMETRVRSTETSKNWRAMLVSVLWTRLTLENWRAKLINLLLATTVWYLIKKNIENHTVAVRKVCHGATYGNALKGDL